MLDSNANLGQSRIEQNHGGCIFIVVRIGRFIRARAGILLIEIRYSDFP